MTHFTVQQYVTQHITNNYGEDRDTTEITECTISKSKMKTLPVYYSEIPPVTMNKDITPPKTQTSEKVTNPPASLTKQTNG